MICEGDEGGPIIDTNDNIYGVIVENPPLAYRQCAVFLGNTAQAQAALGSNIYWFNTATDIDISTIMNYTPAQAIANMAQW
jgi:hypothetical protein